MNNAFSTGMLAAFAEMGIKIDYFDNTDNGVILYFTVPSSSYNIDAKGLEMSGKHLASIVKHKFEGIGIKFTDIKYAIRNEYWDELKAQEAKQIALNNLGYKEWQIDK